MGTGVPGWSVISTAVMLVTVAGIALAVSLFAREEGNPFERLGGLATKAEVRATVGPPDGIERLTRAECWFYGPQDDTKAKICFGQRDRLAWLAYSSHEPTATSPLTIP